MVDDVKMSEKVLNTVRRDPELSFENYTYPIRFNQQTLVSLLNELTPKQYDACFVPKNKVVSPLSDGDVLLALREVAMLEPSLKEEITKAFMGELTKNAQKEILRQNLSLVPTKYAQRIDIAKASKTAVVEFSTKALGEIILKRAKFTTTSNT